MKQRSVENAMGLQYQKALEDKIQELGPDNIRAYVIPEGINPKYVDHLLSALGQARVRIVDNPANANFVIAAHAQSEPTPGRITATILQNELAFTGSMTS